MLDEFGDLFEMLDEPSQPLKRLAWLSGIPEFNDLPHYELYDIGDEPFLCCYCHKNRWLSTGDEFVCDHSRDEEYEYCPLPVYDEVSYGDVKVIVRLDDDSG